MSTHLGDHSNQSRVMDPAEPHVTTLAPWYLSTQTSDNPGSRIHLGLPLAADTRWFRPFQGPAATDLVVQGHILMCFSAPCFICYALFMLSFLLFLSLCLICHRVGRLRQKQLISWRVYPIASGFLFWVFVFSFSLLSTHRQLFTGAQRAAHVRSGSPLQLLRLMFGYLLEQLR